MRVSMDALLFLSLILGAGLFGYLLGTLTRYTRTE
jgi:hypothetical protein